VNKLKDLTSLCAEPNIEKLIEAFSPKIKKSLRNTAWQEREDLEQEIKIKIFEKCSLFKDAEVPGFIEFLSN